MGVYLILLIFYAVYCEAGVTDIPPVSSSDEVVIETVSDDTLIPANIFDVKVGNTKTHKTDLKDPFDIEASWISDSSPIFKAIRDFIFHASDELIETTESPFGDPTEEIVKIIEKGLMEATTMFLTPSDDEAFSTVATDAHPDPITILKIEDESNSFHDRIGLNILDFSQKHQEIFSSVTNTTTECSNCYESLETCVQTCFTKHNCNDVQRHVRTCPAPPTRLCNFFTQWSPVDECRVHEDCKSPLLCCNDGCVNKCSPGIWRQ